MLSNHMPVHKSISKQNAFFCFDITINNKLDSIQESFYNSIARTDNLVNVQIQNDKYSDRKQKLNGIDTISVVK